MARKVKDHPRTGRRIRGQTRLSSKNQATIPVDALREAGLKPGDRLRAEAAGAGKVILTLVDDVDERLAVLEKYRGSVSYPPGYLDKLREEWTRPWD